MADIDVRGLGDLKAALKDLEGKVPKELAAGLKEITVGIVDDVLKEMPYRTGQAQKSVKASGTQRGAQIKVGGDIAPYYQWLDFGGKVGRHKTISRPFIQKGRYLYPTIAAHRPDTIRKVDALIRDLAARAGFDQRGEI